MHRCTIMIKDYLGALQYNCTNLSRLYKTWGKIKRLSGYTSGVVTEDSPVYASSNGTAHMRWASLKLEITHRESVVHLMRRERAWGNRDNWTRLFTPLLIAWFLMISCLMKVRLLSIAMKEMLYLNQKSTYGHFWVLTKRSLRFSKTYSFSQHITPF